MRTRKIIITIIAGVLALYFTNPAQLQAQEYNGKTAAAVSTGGHVYTSTQDYRTFKRYGHNQEHRYHERYTKYQRRILKKIKRNERQIMKYERKIRKYTQKRHYRYHRYYGYDYYSRRINYYKMKIHQLQHRNRYLRGLLHR